MADSLAVPGNENYGEWTFEQVLMALTDEGSDLHALADGPWYTVPEDLSKGGDLNYHAWGESFMSVNFNKDSGAAWDAARQALDEIVADLSRGRRGSLDVQTVKDLSYAISAMSLWSNWTGMGFHYWSNALDRDDSDFKGKAAALIQFRMKAGGDGLQDIFEQLNTRHNVSDYATVNALATGIETFNTTMSNTWTAANILEHRRRHAQRRDDEGLPVPPGEGPLPRHEQLQAQRLLLQRQRRQGLHPVGDGRLRDGTAQHPGRLGRHRP